MAGKISGLGWTTCSVDNGSAALKDIKNDVHNLDISLPVAQQDVTGLDKSAIERIPLLADIAVNLEGTMNIDSDKSFAVLSTVATNVVRTVTNVFSAQTLTFEARQTDFQITRAPSGEFTWKAPFLLADGAVPAFT